ncbi:MAG: hypothetical protein AVDCRST_MAG19-1746, partial [uncultured Thermomicrobiales bacterium]
AGPWSADPRSLGLEKGTHPGHDGRPRVARPVV